LIDGVTKAKDPDGAGMRILVEQIKGLQQKSKRKDQTQLMKSFNPSRKGNPCL